MTMSLYAKRLRATAEAHKKDLAKGSAKHLSDVCATHTRQTTNKRGHALRQSQLHRWHALATPDYVDHARGGYTECVRLAGEDLKKLYAGTLSAEEKESKRVRIETGAQDGVGVVRKEMRDRYREGLEEAVRRIGQNATPHQLARLQVYAGSLQLPDASDYENVLTALRQFLPGTSSGPVQVTREPRNAVQLAQDWTFLLLSVGHVYPPVQVIPSLLLKLIFLGVYLLYLRVRVQFYTTVGMLQAEHQTKLHNAGSLLLFAILGLVGVEGYYRWLEHPEQRVETTAFVIVSAVVAITLEWLMPSVFGQRRR